MSGSEGRPTPLDENPSGPPKSLAPGSEGLRRFYEARSNWRSSGEESMRFQAAAKLANISVESKAQVLDVGCRDGGLRHYLPRKVVYQGIDIAPEFASPMIRIGDVSQGLPFEAGSFDYVFCIENLEHLPTPFEAMREMHRVLRKEGVLILSVPNPFHVKEILWALFGVEDRQGHLFSWTPQTLSRLGEMTSFRLEGRRGTYFFPPVPAPALLARSIVYRFVRVGAASGD